MIHCCFALRDCNAEEREKIIIAAAFHDIGIWIEDTIDYLPPSVPPAMDYLKKRDLSAWSEEIELMITEHHKIREYKGSKSPLIELFRQADLVDFSLGMVKCGIPKTDLDELKEKIPNAGFHKKFGKTGG